MCAEINLIIQGRRRQVGSVSDNDVKDRNLGLMTDCHVFSDDEN
jgi:hypothetical protein